MTPQERGEYRRLLMSLTGSSINIDISNEVHKNYILSDPANRLILLDSTEDILEVLPEIDRRDIDISDLKPEHLVNKDILQYISTGVLREQDYFKLPNEVFQDTELCSIL